MTEATVQVAVRDGVPVASVDGEIDIVNAGALAGQLFAAAPNTAPGLIVDVSRVTYLDSRGIHLLLELAERLRVRGQRLVIVVPAQTPVQRILSITHVEEVVPLVSSVDEALAAVRA